MSQIMPQRAASTKRKAKQINANGQQMRHEKAAEMAARVDIVGSS
jgi:hypothetical protein